MREIPVEEAREGDIIAEPVCDNEGKVLLPKGSRLRSAVLSRLQGWGVHRLAVEGEDSDSDFKSAEELLEELDHRFAAVEDDALMMQIKERARNHLLGHSQ